MQDSQKQTLRHLHKAECSGAAYRHGKPNKAVHHAELIVDLGICESVQVRVIQSVVTNCVTLILDTSQSSTAWRCGHITVVIAVHKEGGFHSSCLQSIQDLVRVASAIWSIVKGQSCSLQASKGIASVMMTVSKKQWL